MNNVPSKLELDRCPQCGIAKPRMELAAATSSTNWKGQHPRAWSMYGCQSCGGMVTVEYTSQSWSIGKMYPESQVLDRAIPERAREYLAQAIDTLHSPAASVVVAASSVDAMLQAKNYRDGSLYTRINQAAADHLITQDMAHWAHEIRLEANAQRHADQAVPLPGQEDARRSIEFAKALAQFLFVLPELVAKGRGSH